MSPKFRTNKIRLLNDKKSSLKSHQNKLSFCCTLSRCLCQIYISMQAVWWATGMENEQCK